MKTMLDLEGRVLGLLQGLLNRIENLIEKAWGRRGLCTMKTVRYRFSGTRSIATNEVKKEQVESNK